jgi:isoleucyl-tRNA synthetase
VHLTLFPEIPAEWRDDRLAAKWERVRELRRVATGALEVARAEKRIGASLQANPVLYITDPADRALLASVDMAEIAITSDMTIVAAAPPDGAFTLPEIAGVGAVVDLASGEKCGRCWRVLDEVGEDAAHPELCSRCVDAVSDFRDAAE